MVLVMQVWSWLLLSIFFAWLSTHVKNKHVSILCSIISILIPSIIGGLREVGVGRDTLGYGTLDPQQALNSRSLTDFLNYLTAREPIYGAIVYITMQTLEHVNWTFFFWQLITVGCFYVGAYKHRKILSVPLAMFLFYCYFLNLSYSAMRQLMAVSILFMGLDNLELRKYKIFIIYVIVAMGFHFTAVLAAVFIIGFHVIITMESRRRYVIAYFMFALLAFARPVAYTILSATNLVSHRYIDYLNIGSFSAAILYGTGVSRSLLILYIIEFVTVSMFNKGGRKVLGNSNFEYYRLNILIILLFYLVYSMMSRFIWYFECINLIMLASLPSFVKDKYTKFFMTAALIFAYSLSWYHVCFVMESNEIWPYSSILRL